MSADGTAPVEAHRLPYIWPDGSDHIGHACCDPCIPLAPDGGVAIGRRLARRDAAIEGAVATIRADQAAD
jgi:hypothetical protein